MICIRRLARVLNEPFSFRVSMAIASHFAVTIAFGEKRRLLAAAVDLADRLKSALCVSPPMPLDMLR
jgi:hypothetical protein